ncbi:uncharacterized protein LOC134236111 [Saccostrea cucullata]|uniref:uncharacterized protein LOC134236111 n=1 Tax=Saccostrea cuccullata TaxID=36930 RepID=UPI002ED1DF92
MEAFVSISKNNTINCELCLRDGEHKSASSFCLTCEEIEALCEDCAAQHIKQRAFRNHQISNDIAKLLQKEKLLCEPCASEGGKTPADSFCKDCDEPEPLCLNCSREHVKQRLFRDHSICDDISQLPVKSNENIGALCSICKEKCTDSKASCFCNDCDDQEPLCPECARQHLKIFRGHKLCNDLSLLRKFLKEVFCEICKIDRKDVPADAYCTDCSDLLPLCNDCAGHHIKQKQFRNHKINTDVSVLIKFQKQNYAACDICKIDGKDTKASKYCIDCDEHLCTKCVETHLKFSPNHEITHYFGNSFLCEPCKRENKSVSADSVCENCEESMCKTCSEQHLKQKPFRGHVISSCMMKNFRHKSKRENVEDNPSQTLDNRDVPEKSKDKEPVETKKRIRGKPSVLSMKSDSVELCWETLEEEIDHYQIRYKSQKDDDNWKFCNTNNTTNKFTVSGLTADTQYVFQVRSVANDVEGDYSEQSDPINTPKSLATKMLSFSIKIPSTNPVLYQLAAEENREACNINTKTMQLALGNPQIGNKCEKTIMLVGATGSGKSTLVDGIINYILGVSFEDPFRFTLVNKEHDEKKTQNHAEPQKEWITVYKIHPQEGSRLDYTLNVVDTPGFGDTRGVERDKAIIDQIRLFFTAGSTQGIAFIDAVCLIAKAPEARLTVNQSYIFHSIMSMFGKDIQSNTCTLITFADGKEPPVLSCLKAADLPFGFWFPFNNSALFASNKNLPKSSLSALFWEMGCKSLQIFFEKIKSFEKKSLMQTKNVLKQREHLLSVLTNIKPQVNAGLLKLNELQNTLWLFKKHQNDMESNKDFTYEAEITKQVRLELPVGQYVMHCLNCNICCHDNCPFGDDQKSRCSELDSTGNCQVCSSKCHWSQHKNSKYIFKYVTEKKTETYQEKKKLYEKAKGEKMKSEKYLKEIEADIDCLFDTINKMMDDMATCKNGLKEIALRPDPLSTVEHIDQMIQTEEINKKMGYERRIKMLNKFKQLAQTDQTVESLRQTFLKVKDDIFKTTGNKARKGVLLSGFDRFKSAFNM